MIRAQPRRIRRSACLVLGAAALCLVASSLTPHGAWATPAGTLSMTPPNTALSVGQDVSITLDVSAASSVHEVHLAVTYNPAVVQVVDADPGGAVQVLPGVFPGDGSNGSVLQNIVSSGIINYQYALDASNETSGGGTVATVQFHAIANGNANIAWSTRQLIDANGVIVTPNASAAVLVVGIALPAPTDTPAPTATPPPSSTPTPVDTSTPAATPTRQSAPATRTATRTPAATATPTGTATARITVLQNSNVGTSTPARGAPPRSGVDPAQSSRANGLPSAGNDGPGIQWWKWTFFAAALMLAGAGWFFTFALHAGDKDVVLTDRFDRRRRRRY